MTRRLLCIVGARPNFVKTAPVYDRLQRQGEVEPVLLHTGQHYDHALAEAFIEQLPLPEPRHRLDVGSGTHAEQTAAVLVGVERVLRHDRFDGVLVAGDVNSTLAAALAAAKLGTAVIHLESGLRSGDWTMPEEINRVLTDRLSDLLLCPSEDAVGNLAHEGITGAQVVVTGNTMIDSLFALREAAARSGVLARLGLEPQSFVLVTLHRPSLVDDADALHAVLRVLAALGRRLPVVLPLHPRTRTHVDGMEVGGLCVLEPLEYLDFVALEAAARVVVTDSGGVQEETSALGVPCITYRTTTERPITVQLGTNQLVGADPGRLTAAASAVLDRPMPDRPPAIPLWDGEAGGRAASAIAGFLRSRPPVSRLSTSPSIRPRAG